MAIPRAFILWADKFSILCPLKLIPPVVGCFKPLMVRNMVVLPAPFDPISVAILPFSTAIEMFLTAGTL
jgi:hypothetical protein